ncbi:MAG: hypothetical protein NTX50_05635 [Candidatus Sumerlaeota bacterium]|nr:hypothetical protein [Candidatus Sumerlaeota bacterium]
MTPDLWTIKSYACVIDAGAGKLINTVFLGLAAMLLPTAALAGNSADSADLPAQIAIQSALPNAPLSAASICTLTVTSRLPNTGVRINASPADINGVTSGSTTFMLQYYQGTTVTLTAPFFSTTPLGNVFNRWRKDGADFTGNTDLVQTVVLDAAHTMQARYLAPTIFHPLILASSNPSSGVVISANPSDRNGQTTGSTQFSLRYATSTTVTVTAPLFSPNDNLFAKWQKDGSDIPGGTNLSQQATMDTTHTLTAVYQAPPLVNLTVASINPATGVSIGVSPADRNGQANGVTQFSRVYAQSKPVTLTAAPTAPNGNLFGRWRLDGLDAATTNPVLGITMGASHTAAAVYLPLISLTAPDPDAYESGTDAGVFRIARTGDTDSDLWVNVSIAGTAAPGADYDFISTAVKIAAGSATADVLIIPIDDSEKEGEETVIMTLLPDAAYAVSALSNSAVVTIHDDDLILYTMKVTAENTTSSVFIAVAPADMDGAGDGAAPFARVYLSTAPVTLTAPATAGPTFFQYWLRNGGIYAYVPSATVAMDASVTMTAVYGAAPLETITISGAAQSVPEGAAATMALFDANLNAMQPVAVSAGAYSIAVAKGFSGYVVPQAAGVNFLPFRRAYNRLRDSATANYVAAPCVKDQTELDALYMVVYRKNGRGANAYPAEARFLNGGLEIAGFSDNDTLSIRRTRAGRLPGAAKPLRFVHSGKGMASFYSEAGLNEMRLGGSLKRGTTVNAAIGDFHTSGAITTLAMTSTLGADVEVITNIRAASASAAKANVTLNGLKLESLVAPGQSFNTVRLALKVSSAGRFQAPLISNTGLVGGAGAQPDINVIALKTLASSGGGIKAARIESAIKSIVVKGMMLQSQNHPADLAIGWLHSTENNVIISVTDGDILPGVYLADGRIRQFSAKALRMGQGGYIGDRTQTVTDLTLTSGALTEPSYVLVVSGLKPLAGIKNGADIASVSGTEGVFGVFVAGGALSITQTDLTPLKTGAVVTVSTNKDRGKGFLRIYGDPTRPARLVPASSALAIKYNDAP